MLVVAPIILPLLFFALPVRFAPGAPAAAVAAAIFLYAARPDGATKWWARAGAAVGLVSGFLIDPQISRFAVLLPPVIFAAMEVHARREESGVPSGGTVLTSLLFLGSVAGYFVYTGHSSPPLPRPSRVVVFGDSLAAGVSGDGVNALWPDILGQKLGAQVENLSHPGDTLSSSFQRWQTTITDRDWGTPPDLFIIELGGNDIRGGASPSTMQNELRQWIQALPPDTSILLVAVPGGIIGDRYSGLWREVAADYEHVHVMSKSTLRGMFGSPKYTIADRIHFSQEGHSYFADRLAQRILEGE